MIRLWIMPLETLNLSMDLEIRIAFSLLFQSIPGDYKNPLACSVASFLHEHEAARGNRVT